MNCKYLTNLISKIQPQAHDFDSELEKQNISRCFAIALEIFDQIEPILEELNPFFISKELRRSSRQDLKRYCRLL